MSLFCIRRLVIAIFTVFCDLPILNVYINIFFSLVVIKILFDKNPMEVRMITLLELSNEIFLLFFNYSLILFTDLVPSVESRSTLGYFFVTTTSIMVIFNLMVISWFISQEFEFDRKKRKAEQAWREVEPIKDQMVKFLAKKV